MKILFAFAQRFVWLLVLATRVIAAQQNPNSPEAAIKFSPPSGVYTNSISVELRTAVANSVIRFTTNGSEPTEISPPYLGPIPLTNCALIRAGVFGGHGADQAIVSQSYTILDAELVAFSSNLPLIVVDSLGKEVSQEIKNPAFIRVIDAGSSRSKFAGAPNFEGRAVINLRGRASLRYPKRSFTLKTVDEEEDALKVSILDLPKESDWILYGPYPDKTLMRDVLAYELSNKMGQYAPRTRFVEVFINESGSKLSMRDYVGVYVFEEKIIRGKSRVGIEKLGPEANTEPNVSGGYIFKKDHVDVGGGDMGGGGGTSSSSRPGFPTGPGGFPGNPTGFLPPYRSSSSSRSSVSSSSSRKISSSRLNITNHIGAPNRHDLFRGSRTGFANEDEEKNEEEGFRTSRTNQFYFVDPEPDEITSVQKAWLKGHLHSFESALYGSNFLDSNRGYAAFIDPETFIDHHLIVELTKNVDGFRFSTFFHKDRGAKIKMGPLWDWNLSFGNANGKQGWIPEHWLWPQLTDQEYSYFRRLFDDPDFGQRYVDRWTELRRGVLSTSNVLARIDGLAALLSEAQVRNFTRWPILGRMVNPNYYVGSSFEDEVGWMKQWIETRLGWIDKQFLAPPTVALKRSDSGSRDQLTLTAGEGQIYFTRNGSDPRAPGGNPSAQAVLYESPLELTGSSEVTARVRTNQRWSGLSKRLVNR